MTLTEAQRIARHPQHYFTSQLREAIAVLAAHRGLVQLILDELNTRHD